MENATLFYLTIKCHAKVFNKKMIKQNDYLFVYRNF